MRICDDGRLAVNITEDEICYFSADTGERQQLIHIIRYLAAVFFRDDRGKITYVLCLYLINAAGIYEPFYLLKRC